MIEPFLSAVPALEILEEAGYEAYFVGGAVRDYLLSVPINDVDIATSATPEEVKRVFRKTVDTGIQHGTVTVIFKNRVYEITTFRTESEYEDFRRPKEVSFIRSLEEDLKRRDFTMNAIAMDKNGKIIDLFDGQAAIKNGYIQTVGVPEHRFREDALRMMRAVRFVSQLSFVIEQNTLKSLTELVHLLTYIAIERKRSEFEKLLGGKNRIEAIRILLETGMEQYLPGLNGKKEQLRELLTLDLSSLSKNEMWALLIFILKLDSDKIETFLREWRLPIKEIREIQAVNGFLKKRLNQEWTVYDLYKATGETIQSVEKLYLTIKGILEKDSVHKWLNLYELLPIKNIKEVKVSGDELMEWYGKPGGPWLKQTLQAVESAIVERQLINDREMIKEWLFKCSQK